MTTNASSGTPRDISEDEKALQQALADFERSGRSTKKGSPLDNIARLAADGNPLAVGELLRIVLEMGIAFSSVRRVLSDPAEMDDAIQETLIKVVTKIGSFKGDSFETWVRTIAKQEALLTVRRKNLKTEHITNEIPDTPEQDPSDRLLRYRVHDENSDAHQLLAAAMKASLYLDATVDSRRFRVSINVGPNASFEELSQILADLGTLNGVAASWAMLERTLASETESDGDVLVHAPPKTTLGDDQAVIISLKYENPIELIVGALGGGTLTALLRMARDWRSETETNRADVQVREAEAFKARSSGARDRAETATILGEEQRKKELHKFFMRKLEGSDFQAPPEVLAEVALKEHGASEAWARLGQYEITVEELPPGLHHGRPTSAD